MISLGRLPLFVVSTAGFLNMPFIQDGAATQRMQLLWNELQADLSHLSDNRQTTYVEKSSHVVRRDDPGRLGIDIYRPTRLDPNVLQTSWDSVLWIRVPLLVVPLLAQYLVLLDASA